MCELFVLNVPRIIENSKKKDKQPSGQLKGSLRRARKIVKILTRDNFQCVLCNSTDNLTIDHPEGRKFAKHNNHLKYKLDKCRTLCVNCHMKINGWIK
jgi:5-methylcytosine-specific restriction endonuclease McrA